MKNEKMNTLFEAIKIDGFDAETQHAFDKLAGYFAVFKSRANPKSPRYITKLNQFQLKFMEFLDKAMSEKAKLQINGFVREIRRLVNGNDTPAEKPTVVAGGKVIDLDRRKTSDVDDTKYANPNDGGEYWDGDIHIYEAPADDEPDETPRKTRHKSR